MKKFIEKIKNNQKVVIIVGIVLVISLALIIIIPKIFPKKHEISTDNPSIREFENYLKDSIKPFTEETIKDFITSTDNIATVGTNYWGVMYTSDIHDDIKILYALSRLFYDDSNLISYMLEKGMFDSDSKLGEVKLSIKFINKVLNAKFVDTKIKEDTILTSGFFYGISAVLCDSNYCTISIKNTYESGSDSDGMYKNSASQLVKTSDGYEVTEEYYFMEFQLTGEMKFGVYDNAFKDTTYCETNIFSMSYTNFTLPESCDNMTRFNKVKFNFDKNYKFISKENL